MEHHCHAEKCEKSVKPELLMCLGHWRMVPKPLQRAIWKAYRPGQCDTKTPSLEWLAAARSAITTVAKKESEGGRAK